VVEAFRARGAEIVGHGRTNSEHQNDFSKEEERRLIGEVTEAITRQEGRPPRGWLSPGVNPRTTTADLLQEAGYTYVLDWPMDDQPVWMKTRQGHILSVPYPHEVNDIPMIALHHGTAPAFADMVIDNFDEMLAQSRKQPLVYGIALHDFLLGQPYRLKHLRRALDHIRRHADKCLAGDDWRYCAAFHRAPPHRFRIGKSTANASSAPPKPGKAHFSRDVRLGQTRN
jgi:hypothetical protein